MNKEQIIAFIDSQLQSGNISREDLAQLAGTGMSTNPQYSPTTPASSQAQAKFQEQSSKNLINVFYGIGAIIAIIGVIILVVQNWDDIGFAGRILVTLGISLIAYISGLVLRGTERRAISQVMFVISAALAPIGSIVLLNEANIRFEWSTQLGVALSLAVIYGVAYFISKRNILILVTIGFATWAYYTFLFNTFASNDYSFDFTKWATIVLGIAYLLIAYSLRSVLKATDTKDDSEKTAIQHVLYGLGTVAILGAAMFLGGIFDLIVIALIFAAFYGSVYLKSRAMLIFAAMFLVAHIIKLTAEYFIDSIGWPIALIIVGFLVIGIGYMTFYLNKKFMSQK